ncbi:MAG: hypothetical protein ACOY5C_04605 [Pseudomonadota bacterium]|uniref:hypothetical protein n=1 Tax=Thermithiobacillus tepidarius TaxID=929 RepID=UPI00040FA567|nr:hypothetical protein [Thermithiobacillus tepidarius]
MDLLREDDSSTAHTGPSISVEMDTMLVFLAGLVLLLIGIVRSAYFCMGLGAACCWIALSLPFFRERG